MADVAYYRLRKIWLEKLEASERGSLVHWVYWLLLHLEANVFLTDDNFENEASIILAEINHFNFGGGDATSPVALKSHCPKLWAHASQALASHVVFQTIVSTLIRNQPVATGPENQLKGIVTDFRGDNVDKWEHKGEAADRARFRIIIELLCYACNSTKCGITPSLKADLQSLGGTWDWVPAQQPGTTMLRRRRTQHSLALREASARLSPRKQDIYGRRIL